MTTRPLSVSRLIAARPERVFQAWTSPEELLRWWGPPGVTCSRAQVDGRLGGKFLIENTLPDGALITISGEFLQWNPPRSLVYSWWVEPGPQSLEERVTVSFEPVGEKTQLTIIHERIAQEETRRTHELGWQGCLDGLEKILKAGP